MVVKASDPSQFDVPLVFSALPSVKAKGIEPQFAKAGVIVCSNASAYRQEPDVPILMPEVNPDHLDLLPIQRRIRGWSGAIVTNSNCTSAGLTVVLKALQAKYELKKGIAVSFQALSGAGFPGVASLSILDNVIPYIAGEEEKVEWEPRKMLGAMMDEAIELSPVIISVHANRVAVRDGHLLCLSLELGDRPGYERVAETLAGYLPPEISRDLPSTPQPVIQVREEPDRPQPLLDRGAGLGMTTVVGRIRPDPVLDVRMVILSHNTIRGAAGGSIYNAEVMVRRGFFA
jgi:aspartate-semialdehyde dehydrogenase